jgi:hypothetical protein
VLILITLTCNKCGGKVEATRIDTITQAYPGEICGMEIRTVLEAYGVCKCGAGVTEALVTEDSTHDRYRQANEQVAFVDLINGVPWPGGYIHDVTD